jgi:hypothetical protein
MVEFPKSRDEQRKENGSVYRQEEILTWVHYS